MIQVSFTNRKTKNDQKKKVTRYIYSILLPVCLFCSGNIHAQDQNTIDSLRNLLSGAKTIEDSITAYCSLTWQISDSRPDQTYFYGKKALALSGRTNDPRLLSEALDAGALAYWVKNDWDQAIRLYNESLQVGLKNKLPDRVAWCNYNLAQLAMIKNDRAAAIEHARASQEAFREAKMDQWVINSYWLQLKLLSGDERRQKIREMMGVLEKTIASTTHGEALVFYYLDMARLYEYLENPSKSLEYVLMSLELAEKSNSEKALLMAYTSIGDYLRDIQHNHQVALQYFQRTLDMYRRNNSKWGITDALIEIAEVYKKIPDDTMAMKYLSDALATAKLMTSKYYLSRIYNSMGEIHFQEEEYHQALNLFQQSYTAGIDNTDPMYLHCVLINLGKVYNKLDKPDNAYQYFKESLDLADSTDDSRLRAISHLSLADWFMAQKDAREGEKQYLLAKADAEKSSSLALLIRITGDLSKLYADREQYRKAFEFHQELKILEDSLRSVNESNNLARLENLFELENLRKQKEIDRAVSDAKIERHVLVRNFFISGFILMSLVGIYLFISFRRKKRANILLATQKKQIEEMSEKIHEVDELKLQFFTNISHELRTPLSLITGLTEQLTGTEYDEITWRNKLQTIHKNASRLHLLVNQILDIRKLDNGGSTIQAKRDDMVKYISGIISVFRDSARQKKTELIFVTDKKHLFIDYDYDKLDKILSNLLSNSLKFCKEKDTIRVTLFIKVGSPAQLNLEVDDTGEGIPPEQLKFIFQPFYQASNSQGGSGLGLALVRELVRILNGHIDVESQLNKGTRITIRLPIDKYEEEEGSIQEKERPTDQQSGPTDKKEYTQKVGAEEQDHTSDKLTLLIVEDNTDLQDFIADILKDDFRILNALNGDYGAELAMKYIPDVIISDIMMPGMDGIQLCEKLKKTECTSHIPILMLTARTDQESMLKSYRTGADDYIVKPFSAEILKSRIKNLVMQRQNLLGKFSKKFMLEPAEIVLPDGDKLFLEKIIRLVEENMSEATLDIDYLASEMHVSRTQLYRKLKALTNLSGNQFIRTIRLKRAAQLISQNQLSIAEVMQETGFSNYSYFNTCFREQFSKSPKEFAENL